MEDELPTESLDRLHAALANKLGPLFQPPAGSDDNLSGRRVGSYKLLQQIGTGGFGDVYMAEQQEPVRRRVALKIIKLGMDTRQVIARFEAERQALAMMDHPNIARVLDASATESGRPFFVMELVKGEPITAYCDREKLSVAERLDLFAQVCGAVQHAHQKAVIHRDIKPSNVLVGMVDGRHVAKVIDFGVAKATDHRLTEKTLFTAFHQMIGTPEYMSPEQAGGSPDIDTRTDIYSLGVLLYELLTGAPPFASEHLRSAAYVEMQRIIREVEPLKPSLRLSGLWSPPRTPSRQEHTHGRPDTAQPRNDDHGSSLEDVAQYRRTDPSTLLRTVRGELDWIVMKCLDKERMRRYETANDLAIDIHRYLVGEPILAAPPSAVYRLRKFVRRHRAGVLTSAVIGVLLAMGVAGTIAGLVRSERQRLLAQSHAEEAEAVTSFLSDMFESVDPSESGRETRVRDVLDSAAKSIDTGLSGRPLVEARLRRTIGNTYVALGLWEQAEAHLTTSLDIRRRVLGDKHPLTITTLGNVASMRFQQGRYQEAEGLFRSALDAKRASGAPEDVETIGMMNNLAQVYVRQGRLAEAERLQSRVLDGQGRVQGPEHPDTLGAMVNLAVMRVELGQLDGAKALLEEAVEGWRKARGDEHPGTLLALSSLAGVHLAQGGAMEAEAVQRRVLAARTRVFGEAHPETLATMSNLADTLRALGRTSEAEPLFIQAWQLSAQVRGGSHPDTVTTASNLLGLYGALGWPESRREQTGAVLVGVKAAAARADATPQMLNDCAWHMLAVKPESLRDYRAALDAATRACELERSTGGVQLWRYLDTLALAQQRNGNSGAAAATQREAVRILPAIGEGYRSEMQQRLAEYERAVTSGNER
ncbi:MAG: hypothetical protein DCC65_05125 [Planctomycetota bacterium]|nr:MAG: hypothetical protein DCC65_05125 [Planctomycetota bacterium]